MRACLRRGRKLVRRHLDLIDGDGQRHLATAVEPRERADDDVRGGLAVEAEPGLARHDEDGEPAPDQLGLDMGAVDLEARPASLYSSAAV